MDAGGLAYTYAAKSSAQQKYTQERAAAIILEAKKQRSNLHDTNGRSDEAASTMLPPPFLNPKAVKAYHSRANSAGDVPPATASSDSSSSDTFLGQPFEMRHERRYLSQQLQLPYPLPIDLREIQRQSLRTLLMCHVFDGPVCAPHLRADVPKRVLDVACGSGYWSAVCHDYFSSLGHENVSFTGIDIAPLAPDLSNQGVNWTFVQHDLRRLPLPFVNEGFDLVMLKDTSLVLPRGAASQKLVEESIRLLRPGGTLEIWESDHMVRSILPHPSVLSRQLAEQRRAIETATFLVSRATPFAPAQNRSLQSANVWIQKALDRRKLPSTPCTAVTATLRAEAGSLENVGSRRVAVPFGELRWERDPSFHREYSAEKADMDGLRGKEKAREKVLTQDQAALRQIALLTFIQSIESLEPLLKEASGKNAEEWAAWWSVMMSRLMDPYKTPSSSECLELGAWWATKKA